MSSKIDPFSSLVFQELNERGMSYRAVCTLLLSKGVEVSHQALRSWYMRRSQKIKKRKTGLSGALDDSSPSTANTSAPPTAEPTKPTFSRQTDRTVSAKTLAPKKFSEIQESIEKEQEILERNPFSSAHTQFLVKRRK